MSGLADTPLENRERTALVTGANRGLGLESVRELSRRGWSVILTSRDRAKGETAWRSLPESEAARVVCRPLDVTDEAGVRSLAEWLRGEGRVLDLLVNNAGISMDGFNERVARGTVEANFYGPIRVTEALFPLMAEGGGIVMVSSGLGQVANFSSAIGARLLGVAAVAEVKTLVEEFVADVAAGKHTANGWPESAYGVSKAALNAYVRVRAGELSGRGLRLNAVDPGWVRTDMGGRSAPRTLAEGAASILAPVVVDGRASGGFYQDGDPIPW